MLRYVFGVAGRKRQACAFGGPFLFPGCERYLRDRGLLNWLSSKSWLLLVVLWLSFVFRPDEGQYENEQGDTQQERGDL